MKELRIIIAGGRNFDDFPLLMKKCNEILYNIDNRYEDFETVRIISGTAKGADQLGERFAKVFGYPVYLFPANWDMYGKSAGYRRNAEMAMFAKADNSIGVLIAFWDGKSKGTKHMIDLANKNELEVNVINY